MSQTPVVPILIYIHNYIHTRIRQIVSMSTVGKVRTRRMRRTVPSGPLAVSHACDDVQGPLALDIHVCAADDHVQSSRRMGGAKTFGSMRC